MKRKQIGENKIEKNERKKKIHVNKEGKTLSA
jgi:hypothetical protein